MKKMSLALIVCVMLSIAGCQRTRIIPDETKAHRVAKEGFIWIWVRDESGRLVPQEVRVLEGYWIASPQALSK